MQNRPGSPGCAAAVLPVHLGGVSSLTHPPLTPAPWGPSRSANAPGARPGPWPNRAGGEWRDPALHAASGTAAPGAPAGPYPASRRPAARAAPRPPTRGTSHAAAGGGERGAPHPDPAPGPGRRAARSLSPLGPGSPPPPTEVGGANTIISNNCFLIGGGVRG